MTIKGKDAIFVISPDGGITGGIPVCCARTATLTSVMDIGETSTMGTGKWKTFKGLKMSFTVSAGGLVSFDMNMSIKFLRQAQINFTQMYFSFYAADAGGRFEQYSGNCLITNISTPTSYNGNLEYSLDAQGTGLLEIE